MNTKTEQALTEDELNAMEMLSRVVPDPTGPFTGMEVEDARATVRAAVARLRPKPSLPERVYVSMRQHTIEAMAKDSTEGAAFGVNVHKKPADGAYTILPEFPDGLDTIAKLAVDGISILSTTSGIKAVERCGNPEGLDLTKTIGGPFPNTLDGFYSALRAALTYANRKADQ